MNSSSEKVKRIAKLRVADLVNNKGIPILPYDATPGRRSHWLSVKLKPLVDLIHPYVSPPSSYYSHLLWQSSNFLRKSLNPTPQWLNLSGFMEHVFRSCDTVDKDDVTILPLIDLDPGNLSTLYSCIKYVEGQVQKLKLKETTLTFDQPLYIKAEEIVTCQNIQSVVIRLGGFHTLMSAVGAIFSIMKGSGIEEAMGCIYGPNAITHIMSGKAIARALRALHLLEAALTYKLMELIAPSSTDRDTHDNDRSESDDTPFDGYRLAADSFQELASLYTSSVLSHQSSPEPVMDNILGCAALVSLDHSLHMLKTDLALRSRTARLWIQFLTQVAIVKTFISCERLKSWEGHLNGVSDLLNLFAASGHVHYAKAARLYLQNMRLLPDKHLSLYEFFTEGKFHAIQRSSHVFNGLWADLLIEQVLMSALKSRGGLTHGRGMSECVRQTWVFTMHYCAQLHNAMTSLTGKKHQTSEQHTDLGSAKRERDTRDLEKLIAWFDDNDPFDLAETDLKSLSTGLTATSETVVNCDEAESVGRQIQISLDNVAFTDAAIKRKFKVKTLDTLKPGVKIGEKHFHVDPAVLFLRCTAVAQRLDEDVEKYFEYELCPRPSSLFNGNFMRQV